MSTPILPVSSALAEAAPESITDLFSRDLELFDPYGPEIGKIVEVLRGQRERYRQAELMGLKPPRAEKIKLPDISLDDDQVNSLGF